MTPDGTADVDLIALEDALERLAAHDARKARVVELRFFGGTHGGGDRRGARDSRATVEREWSFARAWLYDAIEGAGRDASGERRALAAAERRLPRRRSTSSLERGRVPRRRLRRRSRAPRRGGAAARGARAVGRVHRAAIRARCGGPDRGRSRRVYDRAGDRPRRHGRRLPRRARGRPASSSGSRSS